jgi:hypothetical protein
LQSQVDTVVQYLAEIPADRRDAIDAARGATLEDLPSGDADFVQTDMAGYCVPLSRYHEPSKHAPLCYVTLSSQENHIA